MRTLKHQWVNEVLYVTFYHLPMKLWEGNVFIQSIILSTTGVSCDQYPWCIGPHLTGTPNSPGPLDLVPHYRDSHLQLCPHTWDLTILLFLLVTSGPQNWRPIQTYSLEDPTSAGIWWLLKHIQLTSGRYAPFWNAFLFVK